MIFTAEEGHRLFIGDLLDNMLVHYMNPMFEMCLARYRDIKDLPEQEVCAVRLCIPPEVLRHIDLETVKTYLGWHEPHSSEYVDELGYTHIVVNTTQQPGYHRNVLSLVTPWDKEDGQHAICLVDEGTQVNSNDYPSVDVLHVFYFSQRGKYSKQYRHVVTYPRDPDSVPKQRIIKVPYRASKPFPPTPDPNRVCRCRFTRHYT